MLLARALAWDDAPADAAAADDATVQKGISKERTFRPTAQPHELREHLRSVCEALAQARPTSPDLADVAQSRHRTPAATFAATLCF